VTEALTPDLFRTALGAAIAALGLVLALLAVIGLLRAPDGLHATHAAALIDTASWALGLAGLAIIAWDIQTTLLLSLCLLARVLTATIILRALASRAHLESENDA
jgi:monovalent cation/proton antiporter MnhG/PhaG subunit